jgi:uncharacterized membrane protein YdjX (TVP38/TMEM64 family)
MFFNRKFWICFLVAALLAVGIGLKGSSVALLFNREILIQFFAQTRGQSASASALSASLFISAHIVANAVGIPGTLLVIVGGAVYGLWWGALCSVIGATMGAIAAFWLARYLLHSWFQQKFSHHPLLKKLNQTLCKEGLSCVLLVRFSPISPFNIVNFAFGLTPVPVRSYALGTFLGIIPGTLVYTWLGVTGVEALDSGNSIPLLCCLGLLLLLSALPMIQRRF